MDQKELQKLSELARIKVSDEERASLGKDLESILRYVSLVKDVAGEGAKTFSAPPFRNIMREDDAPDESLKDSEKLLEGAPRKEGGYVKVKKIL